jgi:hypothetical protein
LGFMTLLLLSVSCDPGGQLSITNEMDEPVWRVLRGGDLDGPIGPNEIERIAYLGEYPFPPPPEGPETFALQVFDFIPDPEGPLGYITPAGERIAGRRGTRLIYSRTYTWHELKDLQWAIVIPAQNGPTSTPTS